jgi:hypothetical protein
MRVNLFSKPIVDSVRSMNERANFYAYVYVDPRNFEEFSYGKGYGGRKESHLKDCQHLRKNRAHRNNLQRRARANHPSH